MTSRQPFFVVVVEILFRQRNKQKQYILQYNITTTKQQAGTMLRYFHTLHPISTLHTSPSPSSPPPPSPSPHTTTTTTTTKNEIRKLRKRG